MKIFIIYLNRWPLGQIIYLGIFDKDIQAQIFLALHEKKKMMECYPIIIAIMGKIIKDA